MKSNRFFLLLSLAAALLWSSKAGAAYDIFLQIEGIPGESLDANHPGWIDVDSFSHGISHPATNQYPTHANFVYTKRLDKTSPPVNLRLNIGEAIPKMTVEFQKYFSGSPVVFYKVVMDDVRIISAKSSGNSADSDTVVETLEVSYSRITWSYYPADPKTGKVGSPVISTWDLKANKGS